MRLWAEALDMRAWHPEKIASWDAPSRGVTASGRPVRALFKALADGPKMRPLAENVKCEVARRLRLNPAPGEGYEKGGGR